LRATVALTRIEKSVPLLLESRTVITLMFRRDTTSPLLREASQLGFGRATGKILKAYGIVRSKEPKSLPLEQMDGIMSVWGVPHIGTYILAAKPRMHPNRAKKVEPKAPSLWDAMEADLLVCIRIRHEDTFTIT
jgi:hypothetical protein